MPNPFRLALANISFPANPDESVRLTIDAMTRVAAERAGIVCFPECFVPGYRVIGRRLPPPDVHFLERAWSEIAKAASVRRRSRNPPTHFTRKRLLCRAAENTCFIASVNYASEGSPTTSAVIRPDGTLLTYQPYGQSGVLIADIDLEEATGLLASRWKNC